ncbi:MAG TPA: glycosyltransferase [Armatimonadota bacterium]|nr:glycosyltransferase [Armatimonadota bacterium]
MRILFVTPYVPSLIRVRPFNFIRQLSRRHEVSLICLAQDDSADADAIEQLRCCCEKVYALPLAKGRSLIRCFRRLLSRAPLQAVYSDLPGGRALVSQAAESGSFDLVHVEHVRGAHLAEDVSHLPRVYDSVDCITRLLKQRLADGCSAFQRALGYEELLKMRSYEPRVAAAFDSIVITSEHDRRALAYLIRRFAAWPNPSGAAGVGTSPIAVIRNGVDSEYFRPIDVQAQPATIVFSGKMGYFANASAALHFYGQVFPRIRRERPDARFRIVGSDPPDAVRRLARDPAVEVTGYVPDMRPHLASAGVVVCPLTVGVGVQNKVLEAMAMAKPVVATSIACKGIRDVVDGLHLIRVDSSERMADAVLGVMDSEEYGYKLGERARRFVVANYSWETAVERLEEVYAMTIDVRRNRLPAAA